MGVDETLGQLWAYDLRATTLFAATISVTLAQYRQHLISRSGSRQASHDDHSVDWN